MNQFVYHISSGEETVHSSYKVHKLDHKLDNSCSANLFIRRLWTIFMTIMRSAQSTKKSDNLQQWNKMWTKLDLLSDDDHLQPSDQCDFH